MRQSPDQCSYKPGNQGTMRPQRDTGRVPKPEGHGVVIERKVAKVEELLMGRISRLRLSREALKGK